MQNKLQSTTNRTNPQKPISTNSKVSMKSHSNYQKLAYFLEDKYLRFHFGSRGISQDEVKDRAGPLIALAGSIRRTSLNCPGALGKYLASNSMASLQIQFPSYFPLLGHLVPREREDAITVLSGVSGDITLLTLCEVLFHPHEIDSLWNLISCVNR